MWVIRRPGGMGTKSRIGRPKRHIAGDILVSRSRSVVFRYWSTACLKALVSRLPSVAVLSVSRRFIVLTPISARQLLCGNATDDSRCWTPQVRRNCGVACAVNSGPPSEASSPGMPKVVNVRRRQLISPCARSPGCMRSTMGQLEYLSSITRYWYPRWWKKSAHNLKWVGWHFQEERTCHKLYRCHLVTRKAGSMGRGDVQ